MIFPSAFNVNAGLNGVNGFELLGMSGTQFGYSVAFAGDINADGKPDLIVGAPATNSSGSIGVAYVIFGAYNFSAKFNVSSLNGFNGFQIVGPADGDLGWSVSGATDINGDNIADVIIGAPYFNLNAGAAYVIFGRATFPAVLPVGSLNGSNGFRITGSAGTRSGISVASAGDVNGDGRQDFIIGTLANLAFVIFGARNFPATLSTDSLDGSNGFQISGPWDSATGSVVSGAGDINGDGMADVIASGWFGNMVFVIFGARNFSATLPTTSLNGLNGFQINGPANSWFGWSASGLGDINGDGVEDMAVGTYGYPVPLSQASVIFGAHSFPATLDTTSLNGLNGFKVIGPAGSGLGSSIAGIGDINGDGRLDFIVGADVTSQTFVIFGNSSFGVAFDAGTLNGQNGFQVNGPIGSIFGSSVSKVSDISGAGRPDLIIGAYGANKAFVILNAAGLTPAQAPVSIPELAPGLLPGQVSHLPNVPQAVPVPQSYESNSALLGLTIAFGATTIAATVVAGVAIYAGLKGIWCFGHGHPSHSSTFDGVVLQGVSATTAAEMQA